MGKLREWMRSIPLWLAFFLFALAGLGAAAFFANRVTGDTYYRMAWMKEISLEAVGSGSYDLQKAEGYSLAEASASPEDWIPVSYDGGAEFNSGYTYSYWENMDFEAMSPQWEVEYRVQLARARLVPFLIYAGGLLLAALLFWLVKLRKPLRMLERASERIAENELDFPLDYPGRDEMARLCAAFERMRSALDGNNRRMLRMIDDRQKLNDAYTHDLRTPIAVLKGYTDLLERYMPTGELSAEEVLDTVRTMSVQVRRMERFVGIMSTAQKLSDVELCPEPVEAERLAGDLTQTARIMAGDKRAEVISRLSGGPLALDRAAVSRVFENLLGNALRFARSRVLVELEEDGRRLRLTVSDDGPGFGEKELSVAARPYYSGKGEDGETHFGLGLYICRTLCERHGGALTLANGPEGGARVAAEFLLGTRSPARAAGNGGQGRFFAGT